MVGQADDSEELLSTASGGDEGEVGDVENVAVGGGKGEDAAGDDGAAAGDGAGDVGGSAADGGGGERDEEATFDGDGTTSVGVTQATQMMINMNVPPDHLDLATILPSLSEIRGG